MNNSAFFKINFFRVLLFINYSKRFNLINKKGMLFLLFCMFMNGVSAQDTYGKIQLTKVKEQQQRSTDQSIFSSEIKPIAGTEFRLIKTETDKLGMIHKTYQQYYNGIKVHFGIIKIHEKSGLKQTYNGAYFSPSGINLSSRISISQAQNIAKSFIGSNDVFWIGKDDISKTVIPTPELLILPNRRDETIHLAYAIGLGTSNPELKMGIVYIDAQTGKTIKYKNLVSACFDTSHEEDEEHNTHANAPIPFVSGTGATAYSGSQSIETTLDTDYILYDQTRANTGQGHNHGAGTRNGIVTVNFNNHDDVNDYNSAFVSDFTDNDNNWTIAEMSANEDQYALDAHWGAQVVYDYWKNEHSRDSYDSNNATIASYVHFDTNYTNAAWLSFNSQRGFMIYGDGAGSFTPLTNLDVVGHEIGHGVTNANSNLDYELESGALNEGMSDIWAAAIDSYASTNHGTTKNPWLINDENGGGTIRSMSNPNAYGQPDTYGGTYWYDVAGCTPDGTNNDYCGVHTNSGVLNYWFYLLVNGGSGTNDIGSTYTVSGLGIDKSGDIAYRMESLYLTSTSDFAAARDAAIQAAADLYGYCSAEEEAVTNAFYAVGVGASYSGQNPSITVDVTDQTVCVDEIATFYAEADYANTMIWQSDESGSFVDLSDDATYSGVTTNTLTITNPETSLNGIRFRLKFSNDCGTKSTTNNRYLYVDGIPNVTSVVPNGAGCTSTTDGSLTVSFDDVSDMSSLEFSVDGGSSYPHNFDDTTGSATITGLASGDYNVWVRRGNNDCPRELGTYTVLSVPTITATIDTIIEAETSQNDGIIQLSFSDEATQSSIKFSIDGGTTFPYTFDDTAGTGELTGIGAGTYDIWASFGDDSCSKSLGSFTVNEMAYTQIPDANFEDALNELTYDNYLGDNKVPTALINTITSINVRLKNITDMTGIEDFTALEELYADNNDLTSIDVSNNTALTHLVVYNNSNLSSFMVADPSIIERVTFSNCNLTGNLNFSNYPVLTNFSVQNNDLTGLNLKNGNNTNFTYFHAGGNSNLNCIVVDDVAHSTANWTNNGGATFTNTFCNYTPILDTNFEAALEALGYDDISGDGQVPTALIEVVTSLDVNTQSISDLTGIQDFTALTDLNCTDNSLTSLDVSNNGNLQTLDFDNNDVATLTLGANTNLDDVSGRYNQLTSVDVSANTGLTSLNLRNNTFTTVDVSNNINLGGLNLNETGITSLDITNNVNLAYLYLSNNSLSSLDISQNSLLQNINLTNSNLTTINTSNQTVLRILRLSGNDLTALDLTTNVALTQLECADNNLSSFNLKNGFNHFITDFDASGNVNLTCILVDNLNNDYTFWAKDFTTNFSDTYCVYTAIPDANFEAALAAYDDISDDGQVPTELIEVITSLTIDNQSISNLTGIEDFTALVDLNISDNSLASIDISNNFLLEELSCENNGLLTIDVSQNTALTELDLDDNVLTNLDVSQNTALTVLDLSDNGLTSLDVSNNTGLTFFAFERNSVTGTIDLSNHAQLRVLACIDNDITDLNIQNGANTSLVSFDARSNVNLTCIVVDDVAYSTANWTNIDVGVSFADTYCRYTAIPDANFEAALDALGYDDITGDGQVPTRLIEVVTNLGVQGESIADLTGIQDFTALTSLNCKTNSLTSIDISNNLLLESLTAWSNNLTSIDVSNNTALQTISVHLNDLSSIDVSNNPALKTLQVNGNDDITSIDVTNNPALETLKIYGMNLTDIDLSNNPVLDELVAYSTGITSFDVSNNPALTVLQVHNNVITSIDLSNNPLIEHLRINQTDIEDLDLSIQTNLTYLRCFETNLYNLNVQNGNNTNITKFDAWSNPNLTCILVDDAAYSSGNTIWADNVDVGVTFNEGTYCRYTAIPDANFEAALEALGYDDISGDGQVPTQLIEVLETLDVENESIADLTGIRDFRALKTLDCGYNSLSSIDLTNNTELRQLIVRSNNLTAIDLSANTLLIGFKAENCSLATLDLSNNLALKVLWLTNNDLTAIDLSTNIALTSFWGNGNDFATLNLSNNPALNSFRASNNSLTALNVQNGNNTNISGGTNFQLTGNAGLGCVLVDDAAYSATNWLGINGNVNFSDVDCDYTLIPDANFEARLEALGYDDITGDGQVPTRLIKVVTNLNVSNQSIEDLTGIEDFAALEVLVCTNNNSLGSINVSSNTNLITLSAFNCGLTSLDVSNNLNLVTLYIYGNLLTSLDVSLNTQLVNLDLLANDLTELDVSTNTLLQILFVEENDLTSLDLSNNTALIELTCSNNSNLNYLNVQNGNNTNVTTFRANNNASLTCILVDDVAYSTTNWTTIDGVVSFSNTNCDYTAIPDANFEAALEALGYDDISNDGRVPTRLIEGVTSLDVSGQSIADLTGIEDFLALITLNCSSNSLSALDVSANTALESLNFSRNTITAIDVTNNVNLESILGFENSLASIDLSQNTVLEQLDIDTNFLTELDVSANTLLESLDAYSNLIVDIDLSNNLQLTGIYLSFNTITSLDLSNHTLLEDVECIDCELTSLNLKNGNNNAIGYFDVRTNPDLTCILVDDVTNNDYSSWDKDVTASFNDIRCRYTAIPDANFEAELEALGYDDISGDGQVPTDLIEVVTSLNVSGESISDLTGIEDFTALVDLRCQTNNIMTLDLSGNPNLTTLRCYSNPLTNLNVSSNAQLDFINTRGCDLTTLDVSNNLLLEELKIFDTDIASIDLSQNVLLEKLECNNTALVSLDLSNNTALDLLVANSNSDLNYLNVQNGNNTNVTSFNTLTCPNLLCVLVDDAAWSTTNWTNIDGTTSFNETSCDFVIVDIDVFLQGPLLNPNTGEENLMRDDLRINNHIDSDTPYTDGASISELVGLSDNGNNSTVDWIWVELRDATDPTIVIAGQSGILQRDGDIVDVSDDLITPLTFTNVPVGDYYIVVKHRNHLGVMTANTIALKQNMATVDFTDSNNQITYGTNAQTTFGMPSDVVALWSGNVNNDAIVQYSGTTPDAPSILSLVLNDAGNFLNFPTYVVSGYNTYDVNLDGNTQYTGTTPDTPIILQNVLAHPGNFLNFSTYQILEQLPEN